MRNVVLTKVPWPAVWACYCQTCDGKQAVSLTQSAEWERSDL